MSTKPCGKKDGPCGLHEAICDRQGPPRFFAVDVLAAIQNAMRTRYDHLTKNDVMTPKEAYNRVYAELEDALRDGMVSAAGRISFADSARKHMPSRL